MADNDQDDDDDDDDNADDDGEDDAVVVVKRQLPKTLPTLFKTSTERNLQLRVVCDCW